MATSFGVSVRSAEFSLEDGIAFTNTASYGFVPNAIEAERQKLVDKMNANPDRFFRFHKSKMWLENLQAACDFLGLPFEQSVFVDNTTTGMNDILKSFPFEEGDRIVTTNLIYGAMHYIGEAVASNRNLKVLDFPISFPVPSKRDLVQSFDDFLSKDGGRIRLVIIEAIASFSAVHLPVAELVAVARKHQAAVIIDAAHCCGQLRKEQVQQLHELGDFFVASIHKWMFTSRPVGILSIKPQYLRCIRPAITSWGFASRTDNLHILFLAMGTKDYTPFFTVKEGIKFRERMDALQEGGLARHNRELVEMAADRLAAQIGTERLRYSVDDADNAALHCPFMREILLPKAIQNWLKKDLPQQNTGTESGRHDKVWLPGTNSSVNRRMTELMTILYTRYRVVATIVDVDTVENSPSIFVRISAQVYNTLEDYESLGRALLDIVRLIEANEIDNAA